ncbi:hypothetical protein [Thalassospira marina]|uniref:hypothetical protein n=1 Tax=Thalassospira marina TaxID=2048283 RepID=UPI0010569268|nr:hypothetical protein [Thalassospira marina]
MVNATHGDLQAINASASNAATNRLCGALRTIAAIRVSDGTTTIIVVPAQPRARPEGQRQIAFASIYFINHNPTKLLQVFVF